VENGVGRPEMLLDAISKLRDKVEQTRLGANRQREITELEEASLRRRRTHPLEADA
jgi:NADH-quinone oxidoreductase subunit B